MSEIDSGIRFKQSGNIVKIAGDNDPALCDINAKVGGSIIGVKTVATDNGLASDARVKIGGNTKALKLRGTSYIPVSIKDDGSTSPLVRNGSSGQVAIEDDAWNNALSAWGSDAWQYTNLKQVLFVNQIRKHPLTGKYTSSITGRKAKVTVDLTTYDSNDYESANLVVKPSGTFPALGIGVYYNNDSWLENDYNFLEDIKSELGTDWTSTNLYGAIFTPERPEVGVSGEAKGYVAQHSGEEIQGFYIALIPKT